MDLKKLKQICYECKKCNLAKSRLNVVFGKGNLKAKILFIGEAPGAKEDEQGFPFVGRAGKQLNKLLHRIELTIDDVYITNILKCRPPENRNPKEEEIKQCSPYLIEQIKIIQPQIIVTLGNYSTRFVLSDFNVNKMKKIAKIKELHGKPIKQKINNFTTIIIPIYHPSAMMYKPSLQKDFTNDFRIIAKIIGTKFKEEEIEKN